MAPGAAMNLLPCHPLAETFPAIEGDDFAELVEDIRENGLREPIVVLENAILDGRNRYRALISLAESGALRGAGWGAYEGEPLCQEDLLPADVSWFQRYSPMVSGDPISYVCSKNLRRRHLDASQRGLIAGRLATLRRGSNQHSEGLPIGRSAKLLTVSERTAARGREVAERAEPELQQAVERRELKLGAAAELAKLEPEQQRQVMALNDPVAIAGVAKEIREHGPIYGARALMSSRHEPDDSLDYFPTPPWATRALVDAVLGRSGHSASFHAQTAWEPACGEGHMAEVLRESFASVVATDVHDYGYGDRLLDFLSADADAVEADWIITNPPFGDQAEAFVLKALDRARIGVAMFLRLQWLESIGRYERVFEPHPPAVIAQFAERVPLYKGKWEPRGTTATAYLWIVWLKRASGPRRTEFLWIPPGQREGLSRGDDVARFTARPVMKAGEVECDEPFDPATGEISTCDLRNPDHSTRDVELGMHDVEGGRRAEPRSAPEAAAPVHGVPLAGAAARHLGTDIPSETYSVGVSNPTPTAAASEKPGLRVLATGAAAGLNDAAIEAKIPCGETAVNPVSSAAAPDTFPTPQTGAAAQPSSIITTPGPINDGLTTPGALRRSPSPAAVPVACAAISTRQPMGRGDA